jgi:hypothetical protein
MIRSYALAAGRLHPTHHRQGRHMLDTRRIGAEEGIASMLGAERFAKRQGLAAARG